MLYLASLIPTFLVRWVAGRVGGLSVTKINLSFQLKLKLKFKLSMVIMGDNADFNFIVSMPQDEY